VVDEVDDNRGYLRRDQTAQAIKKKRRNAGPLRRGGTGDGWRVGFGMEKTLKLSSVGAELRGIAKYPRYCITGLTAL
jgi:hypothetical protein